MAGFMKNAMSYLGMSDVAEGEDDFEDDVDTGETSFDSDHSVRNKSVEYVTQE